MFILRLTKEFFPFHLAKFFSLVLLKQVIVIIITIILVFRIFDFFIRQ